MKLEIEFAKYQERMKIREILEKAFVGSRYEEYMEKIQNLFQKQSGKKMLYLDSIKTFGKKDGVEIYRR